MHPPTQALRKANTFMKVVAWVVLGAFVNATLAPLAIAAEAPKRQTATAQRAPTDDERLAQALEQTEETLDVLDRKLTRKQSASVEESSLKNLHAQVDSLDQSARREFAAIEKNIKAKKLPKEILDRHNKTVKAYQTNIDLLKSNLKELEGSTSDTAKKSELAKTLKHLRDTKPKQARAPIDPTTLPQRVLKPNRNNKPKVTKQEFHSAGLYSNPTVKVAALGDFTFDKLPGANDPAYLGETMEVRFTPAIQEKAQELNHDPVKIYNWMRDNIEWVPSWGSIQGAELTLKNLKGNSVDTASLLIALLRASGIPARYVHGTVQVPADRMMNWAGGFTDANSAWDFISSAGLPVTGLTSGGKVSAFNLEHVWVEAAIDFYPSGGAINKSADSWVQLDASFKQHQTVPGFDITAAVPFDQNDYLSTIRLESPVIYYQQRLQTYLDTNVPDKALGDAMGFSLIKREAHTRLPSSLPYKTLIAANRYGSIPSQLRVQLQLQLASANGNPLDDIALYTPDIAGKRITLSYLPASSYDEALVASYGGDLYAVPPYLLYLKPVLKIDGAMVYEGASVQMGQEQSLAISYLGPNVNARAMPNRLIAGGYYAVGINLQGVSEYVLGDKNHRLIQTLASTTPDTAGQDDLIGEHLYALVLMYFLENDKSYKGAAKIYNVAQARVLSAGLVSFTPTIRYFLGIPRSASINKIQFDVGLEATQSQAKDGNRDRLKAYLAIYGLMGSYSEHHVFEAIHGFDSVSAVKALQAAAAQGVPIHVIDQSNFNQIFPLLQLNAEDRNEIQQGVQAGMIAITPEHQIAINEWRGVGFIVKDPITASGLYRVSGGLSGSSTTKQADGWQIISLFKGAFAWLKDRLDAMTRGIIASIAAVEAAIHEISDDEIQQQIVQGATTCAVNRMSYEKVGRCTGLVIRAYNAAGIDLHELAKKNNTGSPIWVPNLFALANALKINNSIRKTNDPLIGDVIFWNHTFDFEKICSLEGNEQPTHVGIVKSVNIDGQGTILFIHASSSGVTDGERNKMNIERPDDPALNAFMRRGPQDGCPIDGDTISKLSGKLFAGFGTIRNAGQ